MTRLSTGYTFLNIQEHSKYITNNIDIIKKVKKFNIGKKYEFLDKIFYVFLKIIQKKCQIYFLKCFNVHLTLL